MSNLLSYLDPGSGSYILQMLIAGLVGGLYMVKTFWHQIKLSVLRIFSKGGAESLEEADDVSVSASTASSDEAPSDKRDA